MKEFELVEVGFYAGIIVILRERSLKPFFVVYSITSMKVS